MIEITARRAVAGRPRARRGAAGLPAAAVLLLAACATPGVHQIQVDLDNIQQQLWKIQKENAVLTDEVSRLRESAAPAAGGSAADPTTIVLRLETLEREIQRLQSRMDDSDQRVTAVVQDLRTTRDALQALVATLPAGSTPPAAQPAPVPTIAAGSGVPDAGGAPPRDPSAARDRPAGDPPLALENLYRQGYADYTKGNYALALQELSDFLERYPDSPLADDAQYLMGEVHFSQQQYPEAVEAFDRLVKNYPRGDKTGPAFLKKGLALLEMNRTADAVVQLQHVIDTYPETEEARIARERLRGLGLRER